MHPGACGRETPAIEDGAVAEQQVSGIAWHQVSLYPDNMPGTQAVDQYVVNALD
jgi:hypothetical protein